MGWFLIIFAALGIGIFCGLKFKFSDKTLKRISKLMDVTIILLIFTMGFRLGNNQELLGQFGQIGILSLAVCAFGLTGTVIALHFAVEKPADKQRQHMEKIQSQKTQQAAQKEETNA